MKKRPGFYVALLFVALLALVLSGCGGESSGEIAEAPDEIVIACVLPLSGGEAKSGLLYKRSFELSVKQVNDDGGLYIKEFDKKIPVKLEVFDDKTDPDLTVEMMERACHIEGVVALLGGFPNHLIYLQTPVAEKNKIPYVNSGGAGRDIYDRGFKWIFGTASPVDLLGETTINFVKEQIDAGNLPKPTKVALAVEDSSHGEDYAKGIKRVIDEYPEYFELVMDELFELYQSNYSALISQLQKAESDIWLVDPHLEDYITIHREYAEKGLYHKLYSYGARGTQKAAFDALGEKGYYNISASWLAIGCNAPANKAFEEAYTELHGEAPEMNSYSYIASEFLLKGIEAAGSLDREKIRSTLETFVLENAIIAGGVVKMNENHQAEYPFFLTQVMPGNKTVIIAPAYAATGEAVVPVPKN